MWIGKITEIGKNKVGIEMIKGGGEVATLGGRIGKGIGGVSCTRTCIRAFARRNPNHHRRVRPGGTSFGRKGHARKVRFQEIYVAEHRSRRVSGTPQSSHSEKLTKMGSSTYMMMHWWSQCWL